MSRAFVCVETKIIKWWEMQLVHWIQLIHCIKYNLGKRKCKKPSNYF